MSAKFVPTFADRACNVVSVSDPYGCILGFLDLNSSVNGEKKIEYDETVHQTFIEFKKAYDSVRMEILYNILMEFGVPMKLVGLIKMCLN
jgi:hypothetical protein